jgi:hypothetical protein
MICCQMSTVSLRYLEWPQADLVRAIEFLQLIASAVSLSFIHLLNRENSDRSNANMRLRIFESDGPRGADGERGRTGRFKVEHPADLQVTSASRRQVELAVHTVDMSKNEVRVTGFESVAKAAKVKVRMCGMLLAGTVSSCTPCSAGFAIDIALDARLESGAIRSILESHGRYMENIVMQSTEMAAVNQGEERKALRAE